MERRKKEGEACQVMEGNMLLVLLISVRKFRKIQGQLCTSTSFSTIEHFGSIGYYT